MRASTLKLLDAVYHSALRFMTGDVYSTHHRILHTKRKSCVVLSVCLGDVNTNMCACLSSPSWRDAIFCHVGPLNHIL